MAKDLELARATLAVDTTRMQMVEASWVVLVGTMAALVHSYVLQSNAATTVMVNYSCTNVSDHCLVAR